MEYLLSWLFGFPICLMGQYYTGEIDELSCSEEIIVGWILSIIWPLSLPIACVLKSLMTLHVVLLKLNPEDDD